MTIRSTADASEFAPFYAGYIGKVPDERPASTMLEEQIGAASRS